MTPPHKLRYHSLEEQYGDDWRRECLDLDARVEANVNDIAQFIMTGEGDAKSIDDEKRRNMCCMRILRISGNLSDLAYLNYVRIYATVENHKEYERLEGKDETDKT